jgi:hypothetical protein
MNLIKGLHTASTSDMSIHIFARPLGTIYLDYKFMELKYNLKTTSCPTTFDHTTFHKLETGDTVPLKVVGGGGGWYQDCKLCFVIGLLFWKAAYLGIRPSLVGPCTPLPPEIYLSR